MRNQDKPMYNGRRPVTHYEHLGEASAPRPPWVAQVEIRPGRLSRMITRPWFIGLVVVALGIVIALAGIWLVHSRLVDALLIPAN